MKTWKKTLCIALALTLLAGLMPISANAAHLPGNEVQKKIETYYNAVSKATGLSRPYWSVGNKDELTLKKNADAGNYAADVDNTHCKGYGGDLCNSNKFNGARQCLGFACYMCYVIFQSYPVSLPTPDNAENGVDENGWEIHKKGNFPELQPGDIIRTSGHAVIVHSISGETIKIIDCNHSEDSTKIKQTCDIAFKNWGHTVSKVREKYASGSWIILRYGEKNDAKAVVTTEDTDELTETSANLHGSVSATNGKITEVGMFLGTSSSSLSKLGQDNGTPGYKKKMHYSTIKYGRALQPGTTYYYQAYAVVGGKTFYGATKSFATPGDPSTAASISLNKSSLTMKDNVCVTLNATTTPSGQAVSWKSSNNSVVKVNNGNLEGVKAGNATITASMTYEGKSYTATCNVTVTPSQTICATHKYTSSGGDYCTVCGYQYTPKKTTVDKTMYAAESEVVVRSAPYAVSSNIVKTLKKDDAVKISYSTTNSLDNKWYITSDGYYIYAERLTSTAPKKVCSKHTYTSNGGDICTVCGYQYVPRKSPVNKTMYAAESEVVVRTSPYEHSSSIVKTLKKDDAVTISYSIDNALGNKWYITSDGYYIYAKRLTSTAPKKLCSKHTYTSSGGDYCTVCGYQYTPKKTTVNKTMYAIEKEVVVRTSPYEHSSTIVKTLKKGDAVKISYSIENALGNKWYITSDGYYIYAKRLSTKKP